MIDAPAEREEEAAHSRVLLTESSAPRAYRLAREVAETLGFKAPFLLFQTRSAEDMNAQALMNHEPFAVRLIGPVIGILDDGALRAMIGHEFGHHLAHGRLSPDSTVLRRGRARSHDASFIQSLCNVAAELTADRFALLACQDLAATIRLEVVSATGVSADSLGLREHEYLAEVSEQVVERKVARVETDYPSREFRMYASWLFSRSDEYQRLTGQGSGDMPLSGVDDCLRSMLTTPGLEAALAGVDVKRARLRDSSPGDRPAATVRLAEPLPAAGARFIKRAHGLLDSLAERARRSDATTQTPSEDNPAIDALELRFRRLEQTKLEDLERRFEELERRDRGESK
jgi:hypothetical protein